MTLERTFILFLLTACIFLSASLSAQHRYTVSGYITEEESGESVIGANIFLASSPGTGTVSNVYGYFSITLEEGDHELVISYIGFNTRRIDINLSENKNLNVNLSRGLEVAEVVVTAEEEDRNVSRAEMGLIELSMDQISTIPVILGELDILKAIQLLPGVLSAGEGFSGFHVRGGGADQNLVLLDEATVYNSGHLLGFVSVFNSDAIKNTTLIKGGMPPSYGGRISSVLDIQMREGNNRNFQAEGGIGLIASRLTLEGPIVEDRASFLISGRRTYLFDLAQPALKGGNFEGTNYYFYDLNLKTNYRISDQDRLFFSAYFGRDVLNFVTNNRDFRFEMPYGNSTATLRWNRTFGSKMFKNTSLIYNDYKFDFKGSQEDFNFGLTSGIRDLTMKSDVDFFPAADHHVKFGFIFSDHKLSPSQASGSAGETIFESPDKPEYAWQGGLYLQNDWKISNSIRLLGGLRYSFFNHRGPYPSEEEGEEIERGNSVVWYDGLEPRLNINWRLDNRTSIKAGYSYNKQYLHLVSNSTSTLPTDIWVPSTRLIPPQVGSQYSIGVFRNFMENTFETSIEVYYRDLKNQLDYLESYVPSLAGRLENEFTSGRGKAYGAEFFINKRRGDLTGWIAYTISKAERTFEEINQGKSFYAPYDRRHDLAVVASYQLSERIDLGASFVFGSGQVYTPIIGMYLIDGFPTEIYGERNSSRLPAYHRLDISLTLKPGKENRSGRFNSYWTFSIYNLYNRKNPLFLYPSFDQDASSGTISAEVFQVSLFPILPSVTWNFKFK
ncbi:MAG: TonB-dependent receptor [Saprospirales bacterium]|nr:MAG: TonB-dependent receptor [Saprospirales bacterium]